MSEDYHQELIKAIDSLQRTMGESIFKAKKLKELSEKDSKIEFSFVNKLDKLVKTLQEITFLFRHNIVDKIKDTSQK
jgi:hypothetical protein